MAEIQKEFSALNEEIKAIEHEAQHAANREKYKEYQFKIGTYGYQIDAEEKIEEVTDEDREHAGRGKSGLVYTGFSNSSDYGFIMMKEKSDYARTARICAIIDAVEHLADEKIKDKEPYLKVILGEETK
jgi:hypothetical protein